MIKLHTCGVYLGEEFKPYRDSDRLKVTLILNSIIFAKRKVLTNEWGYQPTKCRASTRYDIAKRNQSIIAREGELLKEARMLCVNPINYC